MILIDAMTFAKQERYGIDLEKSGHFFAVHHFLDPNAEEKSYTGICGYKMIDRNEAENSLSILGQFNRQITQLPKNALYFIFSFLLFLHIVMLNSRKFIKKRLP